MSTLPGKSANENSMGKFARHWIRVTQFPDKSDNAQDAIFYIARGLWNQNEYFHGVFYNPREEAGEFELGTFITFVQDHARGAPGFTESECVAMYNELKDTPGGRLYGPIVKSMRFLDLLMESVVCLPKFLN